MSKKKNKSSTCRFTLLKLLARRTSGVAAGSSFHLAGKGACGKQRGAGGMVRARPPKTPRLQPGTALDITTAWGMNQQMEKFLFSLCFSTFQICKYVNIF